MILRHSKNVGKHACCIRLARSAFQNGLALSSAINVDMAQNIHMYIVHYLSVVNILWLRKGLHLRKAEEYYSSSSAMAFTFTELAAHWGTRYTQKHLRKAEEYCSSSSTMAFTFTELAAHWGTRYTKNIWGRRQFSKRFRPTGAKHNLNKFR